MSDPVASLVASGESSTATTTVTFSAQTAGTVLVLATAADDYATGTPSGWTACIAEQQTFHGLNVWRKVSTGSETSVAYTIGSATKSAYCLIVVTDCDTSDLVDVAVGAYDQSSGNTYTGPAASTTSGRRISLAVIGGSLSSATIPSISAWTDGYTSVGAGSTSATPGLIAAVAALVLDGGSSTSTTANYGAASPQARSGATVVLRASSGAASHTGIAAALLVVGLTASSLTGLSATARPAALALSGIAPVVTNVLVIDGTGPAALAIAALTAQASYGLTATATPAALALGTPPASSSTAAPTTATATPAATAWAGVPAQASTANAHAATPAAIAWVGLSATGATSEAFIPVRVTLTGTPWAPTLTGTAYTPTLTGAPS